MSPRSSVAGTAGARGWGLVSANFMPFINARADGETYAEGATGAGKTADPSLWRLGRSVLCADSDQKAQNYLARPNNSYWWYYDYFWRNLGSRGMLGIFKSSSDQPDSEITVDKMLRDIVIAGSPATVIDRHTGFHVDRRYYLHSRGKRLVTLDLKQPGDLAELLALIDDADVLIEGFRSGVAERIGFGPDAVHARNPRLVYARVTAWGQDGPWSQIAAHDVNVVAATGALASIGPADGAPAMPLNLVADFGGGAMYAVFGILAALHQRQGSGQGQVVDVAMAEGALSLMTSTFGYTAAGIHQAPRGGNLLDGGVPWYGVYATADGKWVSVGALEPAFFVNLMTVLGLDPDWLTRRDEQPATLRAEITAAFADAPRDEWVAQFAGVEACFAPVLEVAEAAAFPQFAARGSLVAVDGIVQPGIAPRFSRSVAAPLQAVAA